MADRTSAVRIALLFPELLGTYGDGGNAVVLARRLAWRGVHAELVTVEADDVVPTSCDLYLLGGGEDGPQAEACRALGPGAGDGEGPLRRAADRGAVVFAVCAGLQILGSSFPSAEGPPLPGLGLLDCVTVKVDAPRAVGELWADAGGTMGLPSLTGFENHGGRTRLGPQARALGTVRAGVGNGDGTEGVLPADPADPKVLGTYLHGPALARNPALADLLLAWVLGVEPASLDRLPVDDEAERLRTERLAAVEAGHLDGVSHRTWRDRLLGRT